MKQRSLFLIRFYLLTLIIFLVAKVAFMIANITDHSFTAIDVANVIWHGLSLDLSTSIYFLLLPFLVIMVSLWWDGVLLRRILRVYYGVIAIMLALAFVADTCLYPFWGFKLDASCLQYLETPVEARASVSGLYMVIALIVLVTLTYALYRLYKSIPFWESRPSHQQTATLGNILLIPVFIIGIRGGLDESTTNVGQVYFSQNQFLNHAAVNPVFSFLSSFEKTASNIVDYDFFSEEEYKRLTQDLYPTTSEGTDSLLNTTRPNIVIVLMESAGDFLTKAMPNLRRLKEEGIDFTNCYGNTWRTDRGTVCTYSGYPSFPTSSVMKMPKKSSLLPGIASTLRQQGYKTSYLYGGDINFTNMRSYSHEPWDVPVKKIKDEEENAFYYLDLCIGDFISKLKATPQWKNLLVIFLPDHSIDHGTMNESVRLRNKIPMVWVGGAVKQPRKVTPFCNQTDLAATLLSQLQLPHEQFRWSRDVLSSSYRYPFAVHNYNNGFSMIDSTGFIVYDLDASRFVTNESSDASRMERIGKAILQATTADLKTMGTKK